MVVPKLACLPCPRLNGVDGEGGDPGPGDTGPLPAVMDGVRECVGVIVPLEMAASMLAATPFAATGVEASSCSPPEGVPG